MKYIVLEIADINENGDRMEREIPVIFPNSLVHRDVAESTTRLLRRQQPDGRMRIIKAVAAGFISSMAIGDGKTQCHGESESLNLKSREQEDDRLIHMHDYLFGVK